MSPEILEFLNARHDHRERLIPDDLDGGLKAMREGNDLRQELIEAERNFLYELLREGRSPTNRGAGWSAIWIWKRPRSWRGAKA